VVDEDRRPWVVAIDDEAGILSDIKRILISRYRVSTFSDVLEALATIEKRGCPDLVLTDQRMPEMSGTEFLEKLTGMYPDSVGIIVTGFTARGDLIGAINQAHVFAYITKPWTPAALLETVDRALDMSAGRKASRSLKGDLERLRADLGELKGGAVDVDKETLRASFEEISAQLRALSQRSGRLSGEPKGAATQA
jgi:DNA-binding NtrC family response regulator